MFRFFIIFISAVLYINATIPAWAAPGQDPALGGPADAPISLKNQWFTPFTGSDWLWFGLTAVADFADLDSSYSLIENNLHIYNTSPRYGTSISCPPGLSNCFSGHRTSPVGEGNPLITGLFGTKYPTALDYTAFGALELGIQALAAWALPEKWRTGAWGLYVGMGVADTIINSYGTGGGVVFRF